MTTLFAFVAALGVLIAVHEWGHYRVALACGVKVLRFSIGFGPTLWSRTSARTGIEYALCALPLGGYVRMLDEREGDVPAQERHLAFNVQPLSRRVMIVAAGPIANLVLAAVLYAAVNWAGVEQARAVLSAPVPTTLAAKAGLRGGELVLAAGLDGHSMEQVKSFEDVRWWMTRAALARQDVCLQIEVLPNQSAPVFCLETSTLAGGDVGPATLAQIGIVSPRSRAVIGDLVPGEVAQSAGLRPGDWVRRVNGTDVPDAAVLRASIRSSVQGGKAQQQEWLIERNGAQQVILITPRVVDEQGTEIGRIGAAVGGPVERVTVRYGMWDGFARAVGQVWDISALSLRMMARMLVGEASLQNLSGPLTIADYAGKSASAGMVHYVLFLALISVSLGVLNLLPIPVLDGGHLMYYLWEWLTGAPPSVQWMDGLQRAGVVVLMGMMGIAMWNDLSRLLL
ncbi:MAG: RIP metalloprotease RseP [Rhodoferax sp.]|nr:MAG: RIP metalloprotease RseP [Rhodoferax sp.]